MGQLKPFASLWEISCLIYCESLYIVDIGSLLNVQSENNLWFVFFSIPLTFEEQRSLTLMHYDWSVVSFYGPCMWCYKKPLPHPNIVSGLAVPSPVWLCGYALCSDLVVLSLEASGLFTHMFRTHRHKEDCHIPKLVSLSVHFFPVQYSSPCALASSASWPSSSIPSIQGDFWAGATAWELSWGSQVRQSWGYRHYFPFLSDLCCIQSHHRCFVSLCSCSFVLGDSYPC